jgi:hypothetical protein
MPTPGQLQRGRQDSDGEIHKHRNRDWGCFANGFARFGTGQRAHARFLAARSHLAGTLQNVRSCNSCNHCHLTKLAFGTPRALHHGDIMLRITIHEDSKVCRLELAGRLEGPWVTETERAWRASLRPRRKKEIDLRQLTGIDDAGRDLLAAIQRAGACFIVEGVWMSALIGELSSQRRCEGGKPQSPAKKPRRRPTSQQQENRK